MLANAGFYLVGDLLQRTPHNDKFVYNLNLTERASDPELKLSEDLNSESYNGLLGMLKDTSCRVH